MSYMLWVAQDQLPYFRGELLELLGFVLGALAYVGQPSGKLQSEALK